MNFCHQGTRERNEKEFYKTLRAFVSSCLRGYFHSSPSCGTPRPETMKIPGSQFSEPKDGPKDLLRLAAPRPCRGLIYQAQRQAIRISGLMNQTPTRDFFLAIFMAQQPSWHIN